MSAAYYIQMREYQQQFGSPGGQQGIYTQSTSEEPVSPLSPLQKLHASENAAAPPLGPGSAKSAAAAAAEIGIPSLAGLRLSEVWGAPGPIGPPSSRAR